ncbi:TetR/AcrR family transcriptional regulator [Nonomuraea ceibae]|uniref:TetR/AcrR family transcriptional regulator n=1 Tax=Nonomuraea ceibae TaxID=1935170 RepID=UPI001C5D8952|nr:TetR family transcriptional regulator [Nonomuraea ceibae]
MPPTNPARRRAIADAAIALLASAGAHGLTHRAVEKEAGLPPGTASNYFRSREALLVAAAERVAELHHADTDRATDTDQAADTDRATGTGQAAGMVELLAESLLTAATTLRTRYLAIFELQLEAARRPALAAALARLQASALRFTAGHHDKVGVTIPRERIPAMLALYGGALFTLVTGPPEAVTREAVRRVAEVIVDGAVVRKAGDGGSVRR